MRAMRRTEQPPKVFRRMAMTIFGGNLGGALVTFAYFRFLDTTALEGTAPLGLAEIAYFVLAFSLLSLLARMAAAAWWRPLGDGQQAIAEGPQAAHLRRRALMVPGFLALLSLVGWIIAAFLWGLVWPLLTGTFTLAGTLRQGFGIVFVSGILVTVYIFLATERIWRERLPQLFGRSDLSSSGAPRLRVRVRLVALFLLMAVLPIAVLSMATLVRANALFGADADSFNAILRNLVAVQSVLAVGGLLVALRLAGYVADSVARPLRHLRAAMASVEQGSLEVSCPVVSNDELGDVTEGFNRMVSGLREREEIRETFGKYVSPAVRDEILAGRAALSGGLREVTILFCDLRGFTPWVEATPPGEVVATLNAYFTEMDAAVRTNGGLVLQFIGDEIEAVFGAPVADARHADRALAAAIEMQARLQRWNTARRAAGKIELQHGIGIHSGTVVAGNIGSNERMSYALVGDSVNLASRIQSLNKDFGTRILVSAATFQQLTQAPEMRALPAVKVKGRAAEVGVYALD